MFIFMRTNMQRRKEDIKESQRDGLYSCFLFLKHCSCMLVQEIKVTWEKEDILYYTDQCHIWPMLYNNTNRSCTHSAKDNDIILTTDCKRWDFFQRPKDLVRFVSKPRGKRKYPWSGEMQTNNLSDIQFSYAEWIFFLDLVLQMPYKRKRYFVYLNTLGWNITELLVLQLLKGRERILLFGLQKTVDATEFLLPYV